MLYISIKYYTHKQDQISCTLAWGTPLTLFLITKKRHTHKNRDWIPYNLAQSTQDRIPLP